MQYRCILTLISIGCSLPMIQATQSSNVKTKKRNFSFYAKRYHINMAPKLPKKAWERMLALNICIKRVKDNLQKLQSLDVGNNSRTKFLENLQTNLCSSIKAIKTFNKNAEGKVQNLDDALCECTKSLCVALLIRTFNIIEPTIASILLPLFKLDSNYSYTSLVIYGLSNNELFYSKPAYAKKFEKMLSLLNKHGVNCMLNINLFDTSKATSSDEWTMSMPLALCQARLLCSDHLLQKDITIENHKDRIQALKIYTRKSHNMLINTLTSYLAFVRSFSPVKPKKLQDIIEDEYQVNIPKQLCQNIVSFIDATSSLNLNCKLNEEFGYLQCLDFFNKEDTIYTKLQSLGAQHSDRFQQTQEALNTFLTPNSSMSIESLIIYTQIGSGKVRHSFSIGKKILHTVNNYFLPQQTFSLDQKSILNKHTSLVQKNEFLTSGILLFLIYKACLYTL